MTQAEIRQRLDQISQSLPTSLSERLLEYAEALQRRPEASNGHERDILLWEQALAEAEAYWFALPAEERLAYRGQVMAVRAGHVLDTARTLSELRQRVNQRFPNMPVLLVEAEAALLETLVYRYDGPRRSLEIEEPASRRG